MTRPRVLPGEWYTVVKVNVYMSPIQGNGGIIGFGGPVTLDRDEFIDLSIGSTILIAEIMCEVEKAYMVKVYTNQGVGYMWDTWITELDEFERVL